MSEKDKTITFGELRCTPEFQAMKRKMVMMPSTNDMSFKEMMDSAKRMFLNRVAHIEVGK